jgi:hypothetical protein
LLKEESEVNSSIKVYSNTKIKETNEVNCSIKATVNEKIKKETR